MTKLEFNELFVRAWRRSRLRPPLTRGLSFGAFYAPNDWGRDTTTPQSRCSRDSSPDKGSLAASLQQLYKLKFEERDAFVSITLNDHIFLVSSRNFRTSSSVTVWVLYLARS